MAKIIIERVQGYPGLLFIFVNSEFQGEYGKVR